MSEWVDVPQPAAAHYKSCTFTCPKTLLQSSPFDTMKHFVLVSLVLALSHVHVPVHGAPVDQPPKMEPGSCKDPVVLGAAEQAMTKINSNLVEGYILKLLRVSNVHTVQHGDGGVVFYLTLDVGETTCHVLSKKDWKTCETRAFEETAVYGQCKAAIFINRVKRMVHLHKYECSIKPVSAANVWALCPDCPTFMDKENPELQKTVEMSLKKFNSENNFTNYFTLKQISRAIAQYGIAENFHAEFVIQETSCNKSGDNLTAKNCPPMDCEFAHIGFCKGSHYHPHVAVGPDFLHSEGDDTVSVECEIYEPEAAEYEKKMHNLGEQTDHPHNDTSAHDVNDNHDHVHDHTKSHENHDGVHKHNGTGDHHHSHDHKTGGAFRHAHSHSHDHGHDHDHAHAHHQQSVDHSEDSPNHHHKYQHKAGVPVYDHDHEIALDHDHKHAHLHEHEHHHHHHDHPHETVHHDHPEGSVKLLPALDVPMVLPSFPDLPAADPDAAVADAPAPDAPAPDAPAPDAPAPDAPAPDAPAPEDPTMMSNVKGPHGPGQEDPTILPFPTSVAAGCPAAKLGKTMLENFMVKDPMFKQPA